MTVIEILDARRRIAPHVRRTPLIGSPALTAASGAHVFLKLETLQLTGSFKARGAFNAVLRLHESIGGPLPALVTASAGNHGRGLACAAAEFAFPLTVFTPHDAPRAKTDPITAHGATLRPEGRDYEDAERMAKAFAAETGAHFISPYSHPDVIAGAGTVGLELLEDMPGLEAVLVPVGGGGLISGVATAIKAIAPAVEVIGVEIEASCPFYTSLQAGRLVEITPGPTLADGLGGNPDPETITFDFIQRLVDRVVLVSETDLRRGIRELARAEHLLAEGAGIATVAALLGSAVRLDGRQVAAIVSGANIDLATLAPLLG